MSTLEIDLECGCRSTAGCSEDGSVCFSDAEEGSCNSQFYSTADGDCSYDDCSFACGSEILEESKRASSVADPSEYVELEKNSCLESIDRDCRICHLSLVSSSPGSGLPIELGCSCKDDLAAVHKNCAETWFKIKGDKTCEICNAIARNVVGPNDIEAGQQEVDDTTAVTASSGPAPLASETRTPFNGHRFLNILLGCMVFAFVVSWLFRFNIPT